MPAPSHPAPRRGRSTNPRTTDARQRIDSVRTSPSKRRGSQSLERDLCRRPSSSASRRKCQSGIQDQEQLPTDSAQQTMILPTYSPLTATSYQLPTNPVNVVPQPARSDPLGRPSISAPRQGQTERGHECSYHETATHLGNEPLIGSSQMADNVPYLDLNQPGSQDRRPYSSQPAIQRRTPPSIGLWAPSEMLPGYTAPRGQSLYHGQPTRMAYRPQAPTSNQNAMLHPLQSAGQSPPVARVRPPTASPYQQHFTTQYPPRPSVPPLNQLQSGESPYQNHPPVQPENVQPVDPAIITDQEERERRPLITEDNPRLTWRLGNDNLLAFENDKSPALEVNTQNAGGTKAKEEEECHCRSCGFVHAKGKGRHNGSCYPSPSPRKKEDKR